MNGQNAYGIMRATRGTGTESIVVIVPYNKNTLTVVSTVLAFAHFCRSEFLIQLIVFLNTKLI